ncbi:MAG: hypothetical protein AB3N23_15190, partial [Paracoccaceae bacterium]
MSYPLTQLAEQLEQTLGQGNLKPDAQSWGMALVDRLKAPVQIVVMGPQGIGKSSVINMLAGAPVVPDIDSVPVLEIVGGAEESVTVEREDGSVEETDALASDQSGAIRVTRTVPVPSLEECGFAEVNLSGTPLQNEAVLEWAIECADIVLWCTETFGPQERALWARVPDELKDHSFLVLTMADRQMMRGSLSDNIAQLEEVVAEEFLTLFPVATLQAIKAQSEPDHSHLGMWKSSGGKALRDAVFKRVEHGRLADQDNARLFLSRFAGLRQMPQAPVNQEGKPEVEVKIDGISQSLYEAALDLLHKQADRMLDTVETGAEPDAERVLQQCVEAATALSDLFAEADPSDDAAQSLKDDAAESAEMMLLFQLERSEDAAADAVTLLMQLKKEIADQSVG